MEANIINMYKNAQYPKALRVWLGSEGFDLRHLFSGVERWSPKRNARPAKREEHSHAVYHAVLYTCGSGSFNLDGRALAFEPGLLALCPPGMPHKFGPHEDCGGEVEYRNFTFELRSPDGEASEAPFEELLEGLWGRKPAFFQTARKLSGAQLGEFAAAMDAAIALRLTNEKIPDFDEAPAVLALLGKIFKISENPWRPKEGVKASAPDERLLKAKSLLERDALGRLSAGSLAKAAGMSLSHFLRAYKRLFGESPMRQARRLRLEKARELLAGSSLGEKAIAGRTGFCDQFHLAKLFKAEYGECPSAFRRRAAAGRL
jgi:AraC-like DNA-binding protein